MTRAEQADEVLEALTPLRRWYVYTPVFTCSMSPFEPPEGDADCILVDARTRRDAIALGVSIMLRGGAYSWCRDQRADGHSPYGGVRAEELIE